MDLHNSVFPHAFVLVVTAICAVTDARAGRLYNVVTVPSILVGIVYSVLTGDGRVVAGSLAGLALGIVPFGLAAWRGWVGAGDAKLFGAIGSLEGFFFLMDCLFVAFVLAAIYGVFFRRGGARSVREFARRFRAGDAPTGRRTIRMGVFVFVGALVTVLWASRGG